MILQPEKLAKKLGLHFNNPELLKRALTHRSADIKHNERLEFLGDSILGFVVAERLYEKFPNADEGVLSRFRSSLVNQASLAAIARALQLGDYLIMGSGELKSGGYRRDSALSDAMEAIMGALVLDQGMEACRSWILQLFHDAIERLSMENRNKDPKTRLQEIMQARGLPLPEYTLLSQKGQPHDQLFRIACKIALLSDVVTGEGSSRKKAEQHAAEMLLERLTSELRIK